MRIKSTTGMLFLIIIFLITIWTISGCEHHVDEFDPSTTDELSFANISKYVFVSCSPCHLNGGKSGDLDLSAYDNIVNVPSSERPELFRIVPYDLDNSYLYMKVTGAEGIVGSRMPLGGQLRGDQLNLLRDWIEAGAPKTASE